METHEHNDNERERGFTLIELLMTIVIVGVLTSVAVVSIDGLVDRGHKSACQQSADAAKAASVVFYANSTPNSFPADFHSLTTPKEIYDIPAGVTPTAPPAGATTLVGKGWTLKMTPGTATAAPVFTCET